MVLVTVPKMRPPAHYYKSHLSTTTICIQKFGVSTGRIHVQAVPTDTMQADASPAPTVCDGRLHQLDHERGDCER
jgi:hypothetical protein